MAREDRIAKVVARIKAALDKGGFGWAAGPALEAIRIGLTMYEELSFAKCAQCFSLVHIDDLDGRRCGRCRYKPS